MVTEKQVKRLNKIDKIIQKIAKRFGLDFYPQEFDIVSPQKMAEIIAYLFPVTYHHWSGGRDYERTRTLWRYNRSGLPYEVVLNMNPSRAYLCSTDPFVILVTTMAHVYGHNNFFKNNYLLKMVRKDMNRYLAAAHKRFEEYEKIYGKEEVEKTITAGLSIRWNIDPLNKDKPDCEDEIKKIAAAENLELGPKEIKKIREEIVRQISFKPDRDLIGFIAKYSPKLENWQRDILTVIREQSYYLWPNMRTKIMNEGWAVFWHEKIMEELFKAQMFSDEEIEIYMKTQSGVLAWNPLRPNPYVIGLAIWKHIEKKYGREKMFEVRDTYRDAEFIEDFLDDEIINDLKLYIYKAVKGNDGKIYYVIVEKRPSVIRNILVYSHRLAPGPVIYVLTGNYNNHAELYLKHNFDEEQIELDKEYMEKTMEHIYELWGNKVWLETKIKQYGKNIPIIYSYDGKEHRVHRNYKQLQFIPNE